MAKTKSGLVSALNELTTAVRKTDFDLFLHYSTENDGWRVRLGNAASDERWKNAGSPQPLVDALRDALKPLLLQFEQNDRRQEKRSRRVSKSRR